MAFPAYVHSVVASSSAAAWPVEGQGENECGCTVASNALNLLSGQRQYTKDAFVHEAGLFFQRKFGGSPSPITEWLIRRHGFGTHFGNLLHTDADAVLRDLIDRGVPVAIEIGSNHLGPFTVYGQHAILLVGYSTPHADRAGALHEDYYVVDAQWPSLGAFTLTANDQDVDGVTMPMPGNRTIARADFHGMYEQKIYFPVFRSQSAHDSWYFAAISQPPGSIVDQVARRLLRGSDDVWLGSRRQPMPA